MIPHFRLTSDNRVAKTKLFLVSTLLEKLLVSQCMVPTVSALTPCWISLFSAVLVLTTFVTLSPLENLIRRSRMRLVFTV